MYRTVSLPVRETYTVYHRLKELRVKVFEKRVQDRKQQEAGANRIMRRAMFLTSQQIIL